MQVANAVLSEWVILRARVEQGKGLPLAKDGQGQEFYLLTQRSKQHATPQEIQAARRACVRVLTDEAAIDQKASIVKLTITLLEQYYRKLMDRLGRPVAEGVALVEEGPQAERGCYNRHPQCTYWARVVSGGWGWGRQHLLGACGEAWCAKLAAWQLLAPAAVSVRLCRGQASRQ